MGAFGPSEDQERGPRPPGINRAYPLLYYMAVLYKYCITNAVLYCTAIYCTNATPCVKWKLGLGEEKDSCWRAVK